MTHSYDDGEIDRAIGGRVAWYVRYSGDKRLTQAELGRHLGVDQTAVSKKLKGDRPFSLRELYTLAKLLGRPVTDLVPDVNELATPPVPLQSPVRRQRARAGARTTESDGNGNGISDGSSAVTPGYSALDVLVEDDASSLCAAA